MNFEETLKDLIKRGRNLFDNDPFSFSLIDPNNDIDCQCWVNEVERFKNNYLKGYSSAKRMESAILHKKESDYITLLSMLESIADDEAFMDKMKGVTIQNGQIKSLLEYDVFLSHASADKEDFVEELYNSLKKLGVNIFYDKNSIEWGDKWKEKILDGTKKAEFAIIVISSNFFGREWTEKELREFLNRQNRNGQKLILPILHNITSEQLKAKYPKIADIQHIDSAGLSCDEIALMFAKELIKRLKQQ